MTVDEKLEGMIKKRDEAVELRQKAANLEQEVAADLKVLTGVTYGEKIDWLDMFKAVRKVQSLG